MRGGAVGNGEHPAARPALAFVQRGNLRTRRQFLGTEDQQYNVHVPCVGPFWLRMQLLQRLTQCVCNVQIERVYTWAILDDGRAHFNDVKTTLDFQGPEDLVFPQSYLIVILGNLRYAILVEQANFPKEWKRKNPPAMSDPNAKGAGYGSGQQRGGDRDCHPAARIGMAQGYSGGGFQGQYGPCTPQGPKEGGGLPIRGDSTRGALCIMEGPHHRVDSSHRGGKCPEIGAQVGPTNVTQRSRS